MGAKMALLLAAAIVAGCAQPGPTPSAVASPSPAPTIAAKVTCSKISETEIGVCDRMVALVVATAPDEAQAASRILVVDTCPPQVLCDRAFLYDAVVLVAPSAADEAPLAFHVFGHQGQPLEIEPWSGPLPEHVRLLLGEG